MVWESNNDKTGRRSALVLVFMKAEVMRIRWRAGVLDWGSGGIRCGHVLWLAGMEDRQIRDTCQYGPKSQMNVSNTLLNLCHEELRQFWNQKRVQPGTSKVYLIKWPVSVCIYIYIYIHTYIHTYTHRPLYRTDFYRPQCMSIICYFLSAHNIMLFIKYLSIEIYIYVCFYNRIEK